MTRASCSVRATAYLSKSRRRFFKTNVDKSYYTNFNKKSWKLKKLRSYSLSKLGSDKVCIIRLDHICFGKSSSTFWQVSCCAHRTRRSCQRYDEDFLQILWPSQKTQTLHRRKNIMYLTVYVCMYVCIVLFYSNKAR